MAWWLRLLSAVTNIPVLVRVCVGAIGLVILVISIMFGCAGLAIVGTALLGGAALWSSAPRD